MSQLRQMKKVGVDPRHKRRQKVIKLLFAWSFNKKQPMSPLAQKIIKKTSKIDQIINQCAPKWPLKKINHIDLAILRLAIYELYFDRQIPEKVSIDEAVELAKDFGSENSPGFVNGVLGTAYKKLKLKEIKSKNEK